MATQVDSFRMTERVVIPAGCPFVAKFGNSVNSVHSVKNRNSLRSPFVRFAGPLQRPKGKFRAMPDQEFFILPSPFFRWRSRKCRRCGRFGPAGVLCATLPRYEIAKAPVHRNTFPPWPFAPRSFGASLPWLSSICNWLFRQKIRLWPLPGFNRLPARFFIRV